MVHTFESSKTMTLSQFIRSEQFKHGGVRGAFTNIMLSIILGTKVVSRGVARSGLAGMLGLTGKKNIQGEYVQKLDEYSDEVFSATVGRSGEFSAMVSEEQDLLFSPIDGNESSDYVIAFDPIDGSSNIDTNVSIGTVWGIYRRIKGVSKSEIRDFKQPGRRQVAAGYAIYGSSTMFVFSTGDTVDGFTLDPTIGEFILTHPNLKMPEEGKYYSCNEGNYSTAGYYFNRFSKNYPKSSKVEEADFLSALGYYKSAPRYSLDPTDINKALEAFQLFIDKYPNSSRIERLTNIILSYTED